MFNLYLYLFKVCLNADNPNKLSCRDEPPVTQQLSGHGGHTSAVAGEEEIMPVCACVRVFSLNKKTEIMHCDI